MTDQIDDQPREDLDATYSPEDNKLRLYSMRRLDDETFKRVKAHGFRWAPKQDLFVAPMWTPERADFLHALCGEIGDENTSLAQRAEERADRFEGYSDNRAADAAIAQAGVSAIADNIPLGQPILVGHHSEKRARKDAERIQNGMRKAVKMWETSEYWTRRAAGALSHADYKAEPRVRARRIKTLEAERRKQVRSFTPKNPDETIMQTPQSDPHCAVCGTFKYGGKTCDGHEFEWPAEKPPEPHVYCGAGRGGWWVRVAALPAIERRAQRWIDHLDLRLAYERALLGEAGKLDLLEKPKRPKQPPLLNYRAESVEVVQKWAREPATYRVVEMTKAEYKKVYHEDRWACRSADGSHRVRVWCKRAGASMASGREFVAVFLTDSKEHPRPEQGETVQPRVPEMPIRVTPAKTEPTPLDLARAQLDDGVVVVTAPQLFPTPDPLADRLADLADIKRGSEVLEPSAGAGHLVRAISRAGGVPVCVEVMPELVTTLRGVGWRVEGGDFLKMEPDALGTFDRIVMNPPFSDPKRHSLDIQHIEHARKFLKPGGRLVSVCANGPRQVAALEDSSTEWIELEQGAFASSGTNVNAAIYIYDAPAQEA